MLAAPDLVQDVFPARTSQQPDLAHLTDIVVSAALLQDVEQKFNVVGCKNSCYMTHQIFTFFLVIYWKKDTKHEYHVHLLHFY